MHAQHQYFHLNNETPDQFWNMCLHVKQKKSETKEI